MTLTTSAPHFAAPLAAAPMLPVPFVITRTEQETHDSFTIHLTPPDGAFPSRPGQFNMLYAFGRGEAAISISGDPAESATLVHTIRAVGTVTRALAELGPGDVVGVRGPFGTGWPVAEAEGKDLLVIAGGIGLAPLRPVIYHALRHRERYGKILIAYGTRTPRDVLFDKQLLSWAARSDIDVEVTVDRGDDTWKGKTGVVTRLLERADFDADSAVAMICGPEVMLRFAARELRLRGLSPERTFVTLERNMQCAIAQCGHCQLGRELICRDGPVFQYDRVSGLLGVREV